MGHPVIILYNLCIHPSIHPCGRAQSGQKSRSSGFFAHLIPSLWRRACAFDDQSERRLRCGSNSFFIKFHRSLFPPRHSSVRPRPFTPFPNASTEREWGRQSRAPRRLSAKKSSVIGWGEIRIDSSTSGIETVYYF